MSNALLTPLELPGWIEFNAWRTGWQVRRFSLALTSNGPEIRAVLYVDRRGRVRFPPNNPYIPVTFRSERQRPSGQTADWLKVAQPLAEEMRKRGVLNASSLPPDVSDVRPWTWCGLSVGVGYTYLVDLPFEMGQADRGTRRTCDRAASKGMRIERVEDIGPVLDCLLDTETRQGFSHGMSTRELRTAADLLGPDHLRMYACIDRDGQVASSVAVVHAPGARAVGWVGGTKARYLADGAGHLLWPFVFDDLAKAGATGLDFCGANIPTVAGFKAGWGARLAPTYHVRTRSIRGAARYLATWARSAGRNRSAPSARPPETLTDNDGKD